MSILQSIFELIRSFSVHIISKFCYISQLFCPYYTEFRHFFVVFFIQMYTWAIFVTFLLDIISYFWSNFQFSSPYYIVILKLFSLLFYYRNLGTFWYISYCIFQVTFSSNKSQHYSVATTKKSGYLNFTIKNRLKNKPFFRRCSVFLN